MKQDHLMAALARLLEPTAVELAEEDVIVPYWAVRAEEPYDPPVRLLGAPFAPDLASFLSDGFAAEASYFPPSLANIAAYVDGRLGGSERDAFETALVTSPELRAEVDMLFDRLALLEREFDEKSVEPA